MELRAKYSDPCLSVKIGVSSFYRLEGCVQCRHVIPVLNAVGSRGKIHDRTPDCQPVSWA